MTDSRALINDQAPPLPGLDPRPGEGLEGLFTISPYSVLATTGESWVARRSRWLALGIKSEVGRGQNLLHMSTVVIDGFAACPVCGWSGQLLEGNLVAPHIAPRLRSRVGAPECPGSGKFPGPWAEEAAAKGQAATMVSTYKPHDWVHDQEGSPGQGAYRYGQSGSAQEAGGGGYTGTSVFDPVLCELAYRWWCPPGGAILDPFAGGSVRGIVATHRTMGLSYDGIELRPEQVMANQLEGVRLLEAGELLELPTWEQSDTLLHMYNLRQAGASEEYDMVFTCPPYGSLEKYSDDIADLSAMGEAQFDEALEHAVRLSTELLAPDRFSVWVIGDERRRDGSYHGIPELLVGMAQRAGLQLYNRGILVTATGSLAIRAGRLFRAQRKLGPRHQYVMCFLKGDPKRAGAACRWEGEERSLEQATGQAQEEEGEVDA